MATFLAFDVGVVAINSTGSFHPETPTYDVVDYELDPSCSGSFVSHGPINRVENGFTFNDASTEFEHFQNLTQFQINESPVTYELIWLPQPEETYVLEPTRFRKTYTFFRQRSRQKK